MSNRTNRSNRSAHGKPRKAKPRVQHGTALKIRRRRARQDRHDLLRREASHLLVLSELYAKGLNVLDRKNKRVLVVVPINTHRAEFLLGQHAVMVAKAKVLEARL